MKSKSFDLKESPVDKRKLNKTFDFVGLYKSAAETNVTTSEKRDSGECSGKEKIRSASSKKKNKNVSVDPSCDANDSGAIVALEASGSLGNTTRVTSTPDTSAKGKIQTPKVKSIMKNSSVVEDTTEDPMDYTPNFKTKKRNKSVSFMLEENEEVAIKRSKSDEAIKTDKKSNKLKVKLDKKKQKKMQKKQQEEKENSITNMETDNFYFKKVEGVDKKLKKKHETPSASNPDATEESASMAKKERKAKLKEQKKRKNDESSDPAETENNDLTNRPKIKKMKKKRHSKAPSAETTGTDGETEAKTGEIEPKADVIAGDLENLSIGDNAHTLTNLIDEMTVVDKTKKKKNKKHKKDKKPASVSSSETADLEKIEEGKEKMKWKRRWHKDRKADMDETNLTMSLIIENLPLKMILNYKKILIDHFGSFGLIKKIGIAEVYPSYEPKPVFTTTIQFLSEDSANKALEEDNTSLEGSRIRVKRPLPPAQTTLVVRSYAPHLSEQALSSAFACVGKIRNIRHPIKGKKSITTAFVEFDGPEAVEKAMKKAVDARIGGKKIHVSKFEKRGAKNRQQATATGRQADRDRDSENEGDSEESND